MNEAQVISRLRMNLDASTATDQGVEFGARFRLQWDQNNSVRGEQGALNAGKLWITSNGLTVEVGNVDTAHDSAGLIYAPELGSYDRSLIRYGSFFAYDSDSYDLATYNGVAVKYSLAGVQMRMSYVDPDQSGLLIDNEEIGISADYKWNNVELSAAYTKDGAGIEDNDIMFVGARYSVNDNARIGLNYYDTSNDSACLLYTSDAADE